MAQPGITAADPEVSMAEKSVENMPPDMAIQKLLGMGNPKLAGLIIKNRMLKQAAQQKPVQQPQGTVADHINDAVQQHAVEQQRQAGIAGLPNSMFAQGMRGGGIVTFDDGGQAEAADDGPHGIAHPTMYSQFLQPMGEGLARANPFQKLATNNFNPDADETLPAKPPADNSPIPFDPNLNAAPKSDAAPPSESSKGPGGFKDSFGGGDSLLNRVSTRVGGYLSPQGAKLQEALNKEAMAGPMSLDETRQQLIKSQEALGVPEKYRQAQAQLDKLDEKLEKNKGYSEHLSKIKGWADALKQASLRGGDAGYAGSGLGAIAATAAAGVGGYAQNMQAAHNQYMQGQEKLITARNALTVADMNEDRALARDAVMLYKSGVQDHAASMRAAAQLSSEEARDAARNQTALIAASRARVTGINPAAELMRVAAEYGPNSPQYRAQMQAYKEAEGNRATVQAAGVNSSERFQAAMAKDPAIVSMYDKYNRETDPDKKNTLRLQLQDRIDFVTTGQMFDPSQWSVRERK